MTSRASSTRTSTTAFIADWKKKTGETPTINQSHAGSTKQAQAVANGLEADVVTFNQSTDVDFLVKTGGLVAANWREKFPNGASPYTTTSIFLVRKGNPKGIKDWDDLAKPGVKVIVPNPKTSGNGRYTYLAAWGYALKKTGSEDGAREFVRKLFANVPVLDGGGRGATTTFTQRDTGDVLVTFENEAAGIGAEFGADKFEVVYPKLSIEAEPPVAVVDKSSTSTAPVSSPRPISTSSTRRKARRSLPGTACVRAMSRAQGKRGQVPADRDVHRRGAAGWLGQGAKAALCRRRHLRPDRSRAIGSRRSKPADGGRETRAPSDSADMRSANPRRRSALSKLEVLTDRGAPLSSVRWQGRNRTVGTCRRA